MKYNRAKLIEVLESFYRLTGARVAVMDEEFNEIEAYPTTICKLCETLRKTKSVDKMCQMSDKIAFDEVKKTKQKFVYQCQMGMYESVAPIMQEGQIIGYIMMGQVLTMSGKGVLKTIISNVYPEGHELYKILEKSAEIATDKLSSISFLMTMCIEYLCASSDIQTEGIGSKIQKIESYILSHLNSKVTVNELEAVFNISRTSIFNMYKKHYGESPNFHINRLKIDKAKSMLKGGATVEDVLREVSIDDKNYLNRLFKKYHGDTLSNYIFSLNTVRL